MSAEDIEYTGDYKEFPTKESALDWLDNYLSLDERNNLIRALQQDSTTKNDLGVDANKLLADCEKMSFDIEIFNKPLKVVALDAVKNIAKNLINSENPNKSEIPTGSTTKNNLGVDCISRAEVLKLMKDNWHTHNGDWAMQESMDDIRALPSVTPQEPILDKIRAEIKAMSGDIETIADVLLIIDKYKAESESQESEDNK